MKTKNAGTLFIVSAPSGAGKTTLCRMAVDFFPDLRHSISYTTRPPRENEVNGIDYHFITPDVFNRMLENGEFLEWAEVHGHRYGTSVKDINSVVKKGYNVILDIDVQGAKQVKDRSQKKSRVFIFILPPSMQVCKERLKNRGKDNKETIEKRIQNAKTEIKESVWYDYTIINDDIITAFDILKSIITAEKSKHGHMFERVKELYHFIKSEVIKWQG